MTLLGLADMEFISMAPSSGDHIEVIVQAKPSAKGIRWDA